MGTKDKDGRPRRLGRYVVKREIGQGGMGRVYLAEDPGIGRQVAIKIVHVSEDAPSEYRSQLRKRFEVEVRAAGNLTHPNIATIYDVGDEDGCAYVAMEYVPGESLESVLMSERMLSFKEISDLTSQLCRALDYAHDRGVIHRDIKPANVLLTPDGIPKIVDFGVAKTLSGGSEASTRLTQVGTIIGTPAYMSPEQVTGHDVTSASDQFSLAVMVYEMLTGRLPFQGDGATTIMYKIVHEAPPTMRSFNKRLPGKIDDAVLRALAKDPSKRYPRCVEFARAVRAVLKSAPFEDETSDEASARIDATILLDASALGPDRTVVLDAPIQHTADAGATVVLPSGDRAPSAATVVAPQPTASETRVGSATPPRARLRVMLLLALVVVGASILALVVLSPSGSSSPSSPEPQAGPQEPVVESATTPPSRQRSDDDQTESSPSPRTRPAAAEATWWIQVGEYPPGAAIWLDDRDTGLVSPAELEIVGRTGDLIRLEMRREGVVLASTRITLGPFMPEEWPTDLAPPEAGPESPGMAGKRAAPPLGTVVSSDLAIFTVTSRPAGASVSLDGQTLDGVTPLQLDLDLGRRHGLRLDLQGYKTASWEFARSDLSSDQIQSETLHFPMIPDTPPGMLRVIAPNYAVVLKIGGTTYEPSALHEIQLPSGTHEIEIVAADVYLHQSLTLEVSPDGLREIRLPVSFPVQIAATPGNCRVSIDGRFVDVTPFQARIVAGEHELEFFWPGVGQTIRRTERIVRASQRIFAALE